MGKYGNILRVPRPFSNRHKHMSMVDRGAQFSPFAALVGYEDVLLESARLTEVETCLDEDGKALLNRALRCLSDHLEEAQEVGFLYFVRDETKPGGAYLWRWGKVKQIDQYQGAVILEDGQKIPIEDIRAVDGLEWEQE